MRPGCLFAPGVLTATGDVLTQDAIYPSGPVRLARFGQLDVTADPLTVGGWERRQSRDGVDPAASQAG